MKKFDKARKYPDIKDIDKYFDKNSNFYPIKSNHILTLNALVVINIWNNNFNILCTLCIINKQIQLIIYNNLIIEANEKLEEIYVNL